MTDAAIPITPVPGYQPVTQEKLNDVTEAKHMEEKVLRLIDNLECCSHYDRRWLAIGRTHIQQGFMAINRGVFQPQRIDLPEDADPTEDN